MNRVVLERVEMVFTGTHSIAQFAFHRAHSIATNMFIMGNLAIRDLISSDQPEAKKRDLDVTQIP